MNSTSMLVCPFDSALINIKGLAGAGGVMDGMVKCQISFNYVYSKVFFAFLPHPNASCHPTSHNGNVTPNTGCSVIDVAGKFPWQTVHIETSARGVCGGHFRPFTTTPIPAYSYNEFDC